jgi:MFS superfamily sulfate permease-like transporter
MSEDQGWLGSRLRAMRFDLSEASGAMGDLGTFIPLVVSLVHVNRLDAGSILLFAGLYNVLTGLFFNQPIPVQPMKAIAAVAIAEALSREAIAAAGLGVGAAVLVLGATGLVETIERLVPRAIVRGIQLGVGLKLLMRGLAMILDRPVFDLDGWLLAGLAAGLVLVAGRWRRFPSALALFVGGLVLMLAKHPELLSELELGWQGFRVTLPTLADWRLGLLRGSVPQLPLTLLNSVIAVCALSADLYPRRGIPTRPMAISVGLMNLVGCWLGAMPMCHGAGGLAGQHRFGARTGGSVVMLGFAKMAVAVGLGTSVAIVLAAYPVAILGVLLCFAGVELSLPARTIADKSEFFLTALTAGGILGANTLIGFLIGLGAALLLRLVGRIDRESRRG